MKNINNAVMLVLSVFILSSCASNHEFSRRKYLDGFSGNDAEIVHSIKKENKIKKEIKQSENTVSQPIIDADLSAAVEEVKPVIVSENLFKAPLLVNSNKVINQEAKLTFKEKIAVSNTIKKLNKLNTATSGIKQGNIVEVVLAFLIPPLAVFLHNGLDTTFWISLILTCLLWVPGVVFALLVVLDMV